MEGGFIKEILTTYWSQTLLLLLGIGYLVKRGLDFRSKKKEINHSLFKNSGSQQLIGIMHPMQGQSRCGLA